MKHRLIVFFLYICNGFTAQYMMSFARGEKADYIKLPVMAIVFFLAGYTVQYFEKRINFSAFLFLVISLGISLIPALQVKGHFINWVMEACIALPAFFTGFYMESMRSKSKILFFISLCLYTYLVSFIINPNIVYNKMIHLNSKTELYGKPVSFSYIDKNGLSYTNETFKNKVVLVEYWFIGCAPCYLKMLELKKLAEHYKNNKNFVLLTVDAGEIDSYEKFRKEADLLSPGMINTYDSASRTGIILDVTGYPTEFLIDRKGIIRNEFVGYGKDLRLIYLDKTIKKIDALLNEK